MSTLMIESILTVVTTKAILFFLAVATITLGIMGSGPAITVLFYLVLLTWSFLLTYRLVILSKEAVAKAPASEAVAHTKAVIVAPTVNIVTKPEPAVLAPVNKPATTLNANVPPNLPVVGYGNVPAATEPTTSVEAPVEDIAYQLEEQAHRARMLLSSDALRHFIATVPKGQKPTDILAEVIEIAKQRFPSEDGWVVLNEERMKEVCVQCLASAFPTPSNDTPYVPTIVPEGTSSLAEMIANSNVAAAFALIGHRPMFSLSDAVADFDALYRSRRGEVVHVSDLLVSSTTGLSDETLLHIISALTSALDGVYTSEAEAVKTAIMKAVKLRG